jgi:hypothetical protein
MTKPATIHGTILLAGCCERVCGGQEDRLRLRCGHSEYRLQHRAFTSLSPVGSSSEKAFAPLFEWCGARRSESALKKWACPKGVGLRRTSFRADESEVSPVGLQYAVNRTYSPIACGTGCSPAIEECDQGWWLSHDPLFSSNPFVTPQPPSGSQGL